MISLQKGLEDYNELSKIMHDVRDIDSLVELIYDNPKYDITNDLRKSVGVIDINYKNICATIKQEDGYLEVLPYIEIWDDEQILNFVYVNILLYTQYSTKFIEDGRLCVYIMRPQDKQKYYYAIDNEIYRDGKFIEYVNEDKNMADIDNTILHLMKLNKSLRCMKEV